MHPAIVLLNDALFTLLICPHEPGLRPVEQRHERQKTPKLVTSIKLLEESSAPNMVEGAHSIEADHARLRILIGEISQGIRQCIRAGLGL